MTFLLWYSIVIMAIQIILAWYSKDFTLLSKIVATILAAPILVYLLLSL